MLFMFVRNPEVPYQTKIEGRLPIGRKIVIDGCVNAKAEMFTVNLKQGPGSNDPKPLHFNPRFSNYTQADPCVVRNSYTTFMGWGTEERRQSGQFPFKEGRPYKLEIVCEQNSFMIYVDGKFFDYYNHRLALSSITHLEILGDTRISSIQISHEEKSHGAGTENKISNTSSALVVEKEATDADNFCKMLAEKLKRLPVQKSTYAQTVIMNKMFEIETSATLGENMGWNIFP